LSPGSRLFLYTDGVVETFLPEETILAESSREQSYENCGLMQITASGQGANYGAVISRVHEAPVRFRGSSEFDDGVCMICVGVVQPFIILERRRKIAYSIFMFSDESRAAEHISVSRGVFYGYFTPAVSTAASTVWN